MAFEGLADKLGNAFKKLKNKGKLSEKDVKKCPNCNQLQLKQKKRKIGEVIFSDKE